MQCWAVIGFGAGGYDSRSAGDRLERERPATLGEERHKVTFSLFR